MHVEVFATGDHGQLTVFRRHFQALAQSAQWRHAACSWPMCCGSTSVRRQCLAEVVGQCRETDHVIAGREQRGHVADQFLVHAGIHFRVVIRALRHAVQRVDSPAAPAPVHRTRAACAGRRKGSRSAMRVTVPATRVRAPVRTARRLRHVAHQGACFRRHAETQRSEARHEARGAQDAQRILDEGRARMAQNACFDIAHAVQRIDQRRRPRPGRWR